MRARSSQSWLSSTQCLHLRRRCDRAAGTRRRPPGPSRLVRLVEFAEQVSIGCFKVNAQRGLSAIDVQAATQLNDTWKIQ